MLKGLFLATFQFIVSKIREHREAKRKRLAEEAEEENEEDES